MNDEQICKDISEDFEGGESEKDEWHEQDEEENASMKLVTKQRRDAGGSKFLSLYKKKAKNCLFDSYLKESFHKSWNRHSSHFLFGERVVIIILM